MLGRAEDEAVRCVASWGSVRRRVQPQCERLVGEPSKRRQTRSHPCTSAAIVVEQRTRCAPKYFDHLAVVGQRVAEPARGTVVALGQRAICANEHVEVQRDDSGGGIAEAERDENLDNGLHLARQGSPRCPVRLSIPVVT